VCRPLSFCHRLDRVRLAASALIDRGAQVGVASSCFRPRGDILGAVNWSRPPEVPGCRRAVLLMTMAPAALALAVTPAFAEETRCSPPATQPAPAPPVLHGSAKLRTSQGVVSRAALATIASIMAGASSHASLSSASAPGRVRLSTRPPSRTGRTPSLAARRTSSRRPRRAGWAGCASAPRTASPRSTPSSRAFRTSTARRGSRARTT
jgi:hypothetical protein